MEHQARSAEFGKRDKLVTLSLQEAHILHTSMSAAVRTLCGVCLCFDISILIHAPIGGPCEAWKALF